MGLSDQIDRYHKRAGIVLAKRRLRGTHARAAAGAVRLRRHTLGDDPAAADARFAPRCRDPRRDPLGAEADQGLRALEADPADDAATLAIDHKRWGDFHLDGNELRDRITALHPVTAADSIRAFYMLYAEREGKSRYGDKTPGYIQEMRRIQRVLPEARFVHIIRDGRDVSLSHMRMNWGPEDYEQSARLWRNRIRRAQKIAPTVDHYMEVHFEDIVADTEGSLRRICDYIDLDFDPAMLDYHERAEGRLAEKARELPRKNRPNQTAEARLDSHKLAKEPPRSDRVGMWRERMTEEEISQYEAIAGDFLVKLGYGVSTDAGRKRAEDKGALAPEVTRIPAPVATG